MEKFNKIISALMLVITLLMQFSNVFAAFEVQNAFIEYDTDCGDYLEVDNGGGNWGNIVVSYVEYQAPNGQKYPAYCLDRTKPGVGNPVLGDTTDGYNVNVEKLLDNNVVYTAVINGYPYKTPAELGVVDKYDAYAATKLAIYSVIYGTDVNTKYRAVNTRGQNIINAINTIVNKAKNETKSQSTALISFEKVGEFGEDSNKNYYSQTYHVNSDIDMKQYTITSTAELPSGSFIADTAGSNKTTFSASENFKIMIPKDAANKINNVSGVLAVQAKCKNYPVFYASKDASWQPYALSFDPYGDNSGQLRVNFAMNTGKIKINKTDSENSNKISGVTFQLQKADGTVVANSTTGSDGVATFSNLLPGNYKLKELSTHNNYILNETTFDVNVEYNKTTTKDITNDIKKGQIKVIKVDLDNREIKLQGVEFKIFDEAGTLVDTIVTNKNGEATSKALRIDKKYKVQESKTLQNYVLNETPQTVTLQNNQITNVTFTNEAKKGQIKVIKVDKDFNNIKLQGVEFKVYDNDGTLVDTMVTNANGEATSKRLRIDKKYTVKESKTLSNYVLNETPQTVTLQYNQVTTATFTNEHQKGDLKIYKVDKDNHKVALGNVEFQLYSEEFAKVIGTYTTDVNGEISIKQLRTGNYRLIEKTTNKWYNLAKDTNVKIEWNNVTNTTIENELKKGQVKVVKIDKDNNKVRIEGVEFEVLDENGKVLEKIITNENGEATTNRYPIRDFAKLKLRESKTLDTYVLSDEVQTVTLKENSTPTVTFQNEKKKGQLKIIKVDLDNNEIRIPNVEFEVYDKAGKVVDTLVTDENGEAVSKKLPIDQEYTVKEVKTGEWYVLNTNEQKITLEYNKIKDITFMNEKKKGQLKIIKVDLDNNEILLEGVTFDILDEQGNVVDTVITNEKGEALTKRLPIDQQYTAVEKETRQEYVLTEETQTVTLKQDEVTNIIMKNEKKKGKIRVIKIDADNTEIRIPNVEFNVYNELGELVDTLITDENGEAISQRLPIDQKYTLQETKTGEWYVLNKQPQTTTVEYNKITNITFTNEKKKGQLKIIKVDLDDHEVLLEGVTFDILDESGNVVDTVKTDENGEATTKRLPIDQQYTAVEKETRKEYVLTEETQTVTLKQDEATPITVENEKVKGYVEVTKIDSETKEKLQGAKFGIYNEKDELVGELTTDENGKAKSELLPYGKYYLKELETSSVYYLLNENTYEFEITKNHETIPVTIENDGVDIEVTVDKEGTSEIKPGEKVDYVFTNVGNASNVFLENFKWYDYIPTDYIRLEKMTTGIWNQDLTYDVYYKTNKSEDYVLFKEDLSTKENYDLDFTTIQLSEDEYIVETCFDFGKVDVGFRESTSPTMQCKSFDTLKDGETFTNYTKTVGVYYGITAEANSKWTTVVHIPEEKHEPVLPRTGE